jgi:hypothetical protein
MISHENQDGLSVAFGLILLRHRTVRILAPTLRRQQDPHRKVHEQNSSEREANTQGPQRPLRVVERDTDERHCRQRHSNARPQQPLLVQDRDAQRAIAFDFIAWYVT